jgi:hypothetical protein
MTDLLKILASAALSWAVSSIASATPPTLLRTPGYQSPVHAGPDDLLMIPGSGFRETDRVVYRAYDAGDRPKTVPTQSSATEGLASVVKISDPAAALTVRMPTELDGNEPYHLWVVDAAGEWSQPVSINDPRPLWFSPAYVFSTADLAGLGRTVRVIGRNMRPSPGGQMQIRLQGRNTYLLRTQPQDRDSSAGDYITEGALPARLEPDTYVVQTSRDGRTWLSIPSQQLEVRADPAPLQRFDVSDSKYGGCHPDDHADDTGCFREAIEAAGRAGSGTVFIPAGTWDIDIHQLRGDEQRNGFIVPRRVNVQGAGAKLTSIVRHAAKEAPAPGALLTLIGSSSVTGIAFTDDTTYQSLQQTRVTIQLGTRPGNTADGMPEGVEDIVICANYFYRVGRAVADSTRPIRHLFVTRNEFGGYDNALLLTGSGANRARPYRIDDSLVRWNRFVPGSYLDVPGRQGTVATQLGAGNRVDFSSNVADGTSRQGLQQPDDPSGWRAGFFWNLNNGQEEVLIAQNRISCPGDKAGDGEAIALDGNGATYAFDAAPRVEAAGADWVRVRVTLRHDQFGSPVPANYYAGHWVSVLAGTGLGQVRKLSGYTENSDGTVTLRVSPAWDLAPLGARVGVARQYWQMYVVANEVDQSAPPCRKGNMTDERGGVIVFWTPIADSTIDGNRQKQADGIQLGSGYSERTPACPKCAGSFGFLVGIEVRNNTVEGEYDWTSDCSWSGVRAYFLALGGADALPTAVNFGLLIAHNTVSGADGQRGGAIDFAHSGPSGPPPGKWPLVLNPLIFSNTLRDIDGPLPRPKCNQKQQVRAGIRLEGPDNIHDAVLASNRCERVATRLEDTGVGTTRLCSSHEPDSCECEGH